MGVFTEQVQNVATSQRELISEAKRKRLEREETKRQKEKLEQLEMNLYNILDSYFNDEEIERRDYKKQYIILSHAQNKHNIIDELTKNDKEVYYLEKKYNSILNNVYNGYKTYWNDKYKNEQKDSLKKAELKLYKTIKNTLTLRELHTQRQSYYFNTSQEAYEFLIKANNKNLIINMLGQTIEQRYLLDKKYFNILNTLYKPFKMDSKAIKQQSKQTILLKQKNSRSGNKGEKIGLLINILMGIFAIITKLFLIFIVAPLVFIISFFIYKK